MIENNKFDQYYLHKYLSIDGKDRYLALEVLRSLECYYHLYPRADKSLVTKPFSYLLSVVRSIQEPITQELNETKFISIEEFIENIALSQEEALHKAESIVFVSRYGINDSPKKLADIGDELEISKERVRQLLNRANRKILVKGKRQIRNCDTLAPCAKLILGIRSAINPEMDGASERVVDFIDEFLYYIPLTRALNLVCYFSFEQSSVVRKQTKLAREIFKQRIAKKRENAKYESRKNVLEKRLNDLIQFAIWPSETQKISFEVLSSFRRSRDVSHDGDGNAGFYFSDKLNREVQYESELELNFLEILETSTEVVFYQEQPFKIPYSENGEDKNYYPDIFFVMKNNQAIVVEIKPYFQMALQNNLDKWAALKQFCIKHCFGMLITDGRNSIQQVMRHEVNPSYAEKILSVLSNRSLTWQEYNQIRCEFNIKHIDFMALVLKERLVWQLSPFKLFKRCI
jgi:hypothetical protein